MLTVNETLGMFDRESITLTFNHADIVGPVSYGEGDGFLVFLDEIDDERLL